MYNNKYEIDLNNQFRQLQLCISLGNLNHDERYYSLFPQVCDNQSPWCSHWLWVAGWWVCPGSTNPWDQACQKVFVYPQKPKQTHQEAENKEILNRKHLRNIWRIYDWRNGKELIWYVEKKWIDLLFYKTARIIEE